MSPISEAIPIQSMMAGSIKAASAVVKITNFSNKRISHQGQGHSRMNSDHLIWPQAFHQIFNYMNITSLAALDQMGILE